MLNKETIVEEILEEVEQDIHDEEIIHLLLQSQVSKDLHTKPKESYSFGDKAADKLANFVGSWTFVIGFLCFLILWMILNVILALKAFDPYPFILLNLVLSCIAAIQAPLIMMSQNRQEQKDRQRAENDYKVNLKAEIIVQDLHLKIDQLLENQNRLLTYLNEKEGKRGIDS